MLLLAKALRTNLRAITNGSAVGTSTNTSHFSYPYSGETSLCFWQLGNCQQLYVVAL